MKNNRLKFRAWDKERKEMRQVKLMDWSDWWVSTGSTWERETPLKYGERNSFKNEETDRHIIMQYTGFKDKNGKEIYEGDIVKGVGKHIGQSNVFYGDIGELQPMSYLNDYNFNNYEVIGNIYENPEIINYI